MATFAKGILGASLTVALIFGGGLSASAATASTPAPTAPPLTESQQAAISGPVSVDVAVNQILKETNAARKDLDRGPVLLNKELNRVAQAWSEQQFKNGAMSHNPNLSKQVPAGAVLVGENVAMGYGYMDVTTGWLNSWGHLANIVNPKYTDIGIGYYEKDGQRYYTQIFAYYDRPEEAVGELTASNITSTGFRLDWKAPVSTPSPVTGYQLVFQPMGGALKVIELTEPTITFTDLKPDTVQTVTVQARTDLGVAPNSRRTVLRTAKAPQVPVAPAVPTGLSAVNLNYSDATANWSAVTGATGYTVRLFDKAGKELSSQSVTAPTLKFGKLTAGTAYSYTVAATNAGGTSAQSAKFAFTTRKASTPGLAVNPQVSSITAKSAKLSWAAAPDNGSAITGYTVVLTNTVTKKSNTLTTTKLTSSFGSLTANTAYTATITAKNAAGTGTATSVRFVTAKAK